MQVFPANSRIFRPRELAVPSNRIEKLSVESPFKQEQEQNSLTSIPQPQDSLSLTTLLGSIPEDVPTSVEVDRSEPFHDSNVGRFTDPLRPLLNDPTVKGLPATAEPYRGKVSSNVGGTDTTVTVDLYDDFGQVAATLLMPLKTGTTYYVPAECYPQYVTGDNIIVFKTADDTWYAPGPFIPHETFHFGQTLRATLDTPTNGNTFTFNLDDDTGTEQTTGAESGITGYYLPSQAAITLTSNYPILVDNMKVLVAEQRSEVWYLVWPTLNLVVNITQLQTNYRFDDPDFQIKTRADIKVFATGDESGWATIHSGTECP